MKGYICLRITQMFNEYSDIRRKRSTPEKKKKKCLIIVRHSEKSDNTKYMCSAYANFIF